MDAKIFKLIRLLSAKDLKEINARLKFSENKADRRHFEILEYLSQFHPRMDDPNLEKEKIRIKLFPKTKTESHEIRNTFSDLSKVLENFLIQKELEEDKVRRKLLLLKIYNKKNSKDLFSSSLRQVEKELKTSKFFDTDFQRKVIDFQQFKLKVFDAKKPDEVYNDFNKALEKLEHFYQLEKVVINARVRCLSKMHIPATKSTIKHKKNIQFKLYELAKDLYSTNNNNRIFEKLKAVFKNHVNELSQEVRVEIFQLLINYLADQSQKSAGNSFQSIFDLFKWADNANALVLNNRINPGPYSNCVKIACLVGEIDWAEGFVKKHQKFLDPVLDIDVITYVKATIHIYKSEQEQAYKILFFHSFSNPFLENVARIDMLKCGYELYFENKLKFKGITNTIEAYQKKMRRLKGLPKERKQGFLNFSSILLALTKRKMKNEFRYRSKDVVKRKIDSFKRLPVRDWLLQKLEEQD